MNSIIHHKIKSKFKNYDCEKIINLVEEMLFGSKYTRSLIYNHVLQSFGKNDEEANNIYIEILNGALTMIDDVADNSKIRSGRSCYHLKRGMRSLRDGSFLISLGHVMISRKCRSIYQESNYITWIGQVLDTMKKGREEYNWELYEKTCMYKTGAFSFYLPLCSGYIQSGIIPPAYFYDFSMVIGFIGQLQDDYINFFPEKSKKTESDLENGKLTYFTIRLNKEGGKEVEEYFKTFKVTPYIKNKVYSYFEDFNQKLRDLIDYSKKMIVSDEDRLRTKGVYDVLKIYNVELVD